MDYHLTQLSGDILVGIVNEQLRLNCQDKQDLFYQLDIPSAQLEQKLADLEHRRFELAIGCANNAAGNDQLALVLGHPANQRRQEQRPPDAHGEKRVANRVGTILQAEGFRR